MDKIILRSGIPSLIYPIYTSTKDDFALKSPPQSQLDQPLKQDPTSQEEDHRSKSKLLLKIKPYPSIIMQLLLKVQFHLLPCFPQSYHRWMT